jgi:acetylglutamate kinase
VSGSDGQRLERISSAQAEELIASGVISGGMVPKVRAALGALSWDGAEAVIADAATPAALRRALDEPRFGTHISLAPASAGAAAVLS